MYTGKIDLQNVDGSCSLGVLVASDELLLDELYNFVEDHLIKNQSNWIKDNFEALKNKLSKFIELVRFYEISSADFFYKVRPYKSILPSDLYEDIVSYHMATSTPKYPDLVFRCNIEFDSTLLKKGQL